MKVVAVSKGDDGPFVMPSADTVDDGSYPIARDLYLYTRGQPRARWASTSAGSWTGRPSRSSGELGFVPVN